MPRIRPLRPRCDTPDIVRLNAEHAAGRTWRDLWNEYVSTASNPYGFKTFLNVVRSREPSQIAPSAEIAHQEYVDAENYWSAHVAPNARILTVADAGLIKVKGGRLIVYSAGRTTEIAPEGRKPSAVVFTGWGGIVSVEAIRLAIRLGVAIVAIDWEYDLLTVAHGAARVAASLVRAQTTADPMLIARQVVNARIAHSANIGVITHAEAIEFEVQTAASRDLASLHRVEAGFAKRYFGRLDFSMTYRRGASPWTKWAQRHSGSGNPRSAKHPVNAILNMAYSVTAGRIGALLGSRGLCLSIGFLHSDRPQRNSLCWDAVETLRPMIDAAAMKFLSQKKFGRGDFIRLPEGVVRLTPQLARVVAQEIAPPMRDIERAADFMIGLIKSQDRARSCVARRPEADR